MARLYVSLCGETSQRGVSTGFDGAKCHPGRWVQCWIDVLI